MATPMERDKIGPLFMVRSGTLRSALKWLETGQLRVAHVGEGGIRDLG